MKAKPWSYFDGNVELRGELYNPVGASNGAAILIVHEADGIGGNVRAHCAKLAELGYLAAAADMHGGGRVLAGDEMVAALAAFRSDASLLRGRVRAALNALAKLPEVDPGRIAAIGFCFGGFAVLELARDGAPVKAVASFHGLLTTSQPAAAGAVSARVLVGTGALDPLVPKDDVAAFETEMQSAQVDWHLLVHGRALHSYTNAAVDGLGDDRMAYGPSAHALSWAVLQCFLNDTFEVTP